MCVFIPNRIPSPRKARLFPKSYFFYNNMHAYVYYPGELNLKLNAVSSVKGRQTIPVSP